MSGDTKQNWREEQAKAEIGETQISRPLSVFITIAFIVVLLSGPALQVSAWLTERAESGRSDRLDFLKRFNGSGAEMVNAWRTGAGFIDSSLAANTVLLRRIDAFQSAMDDSCIWTKFTAAPVQDLLCRLGAGNEKAIVGRDGWLFYDSDIRYITGAGFLDQAQMKRRSMTGNEYSAPPQPDPVACIVGFRDQLKQRGIELVVFPVPVKPTIYPEMLASGLNQSAAPLQNPSFDDFKERLGREGVHVFDPAPLLVEAKRDAVQYLKTDTHWQPRAGRLVAEGLASRISALGIDLAPADEPAYSQNALAYTNIGDIAAMLKLSADQRLFPEEVVSFQPVNGSDAEKADVLFLGDSFANIYSAAEMGWGERGGFAYQLSAAMKRPIQRIIRNDAGASATREMLAIEMLRGKDVLNGVKLVIWEFAARELAFGDWKLIDLKYRSGSVPDDAGVSGVMQVSGIVEGVSGRPVKGAPYKDFIMKLYVKDIVTADGGLYNSGDGVVHVFAMRDREILPVSGIQAGVRISFAVQAWSEVEKRYSTLKTGPLSDTILELEKDLYWGESVQEQK